MTMTPDAMRARFDDLGREKDGILAQSAPLRAQHAAITSVIEQKKAEARPVFEQIKKIEAGLFDIDQERAALARALGGKTMSQAPATVQPPIMDGSNVILLERLKGLEAESQAQKAKAEKDADEMAKIKQFLADLNTNMQQS